MTVFYRDSAAVPAEQILEELRTGAADVGIPKATADALFAAAAARNADECVMLEQLIPSLECITEIRFGALDAA
jgi:hypothetical protein